MYFSIDLCTETNIDLNNYKAVKRRAILIGSPGTRDNFLDGVENDLSNFKNYLLSDAGGAWNENEITVSYNPTFERASSLVHRSAEDYALVYLSGHGYTNRLNERMFCLRDLHVADTNFLNESPRQLIIVDACRTIFTGIGAPPPPPFGPRWEHLEGSPVRELFDRCIRNSWPGKMIIHSTQHGEVSYDNLRGDGGVFMLALLKMASKMRSPDFGYKPVRINSILNKVPIELRKQGNRQVPSTVYESGNLTVPFAIAAPHNEFVNDVPESHNKSNSSGGGVGGFLLFTGLVLLVAALSKD